MSGTVEYVIGAHAYCQDGPCGELVRVVVDPVKRAITHLVVQHEHGRDLGRLVPVDIVEVATERELRLRCTREELEKLESAKEIELLPVGHDQFSAEYGYPASQVLMRPYFALTSRSGLRMDPRDIHRQQTVTHDRVPLGEVEIRRGQSVEASDGPIGRVRGFGVDPGDYHVTHVLLDEGHLWGEKEVSIPISAVTGVDDIDGVRLSLTKAEVADLPPVEVERHG